MQDAEVSFAVFKSFSKKRNRSNVILHVLEPPPPPPPPPTTTIPPLPTPPLPPPPPTTATTLRNYTLLPKVHLLKDIIGQSQAIEKLRSYMTQFKHLPAHQPKYPLAIFHGRPGVGKTATAYAVAREYGYDVHEVNASDTRSYQDITKVLHKSGFGASLSGRPKMILLDELDGAYDQESNSIKAIIDFLERFPVLETRSPIICTCNIASAPVLKKLKILNVAQWICFPKLYASNMKLVLKNITTQYGISTLPQYKQEVLIRDADGDVRQLAALLYMQRLRLSSSSSLSSKDVGSSPFDVAKLVMSTVSTPEHLDIGTCYIAAIIESNIPYWFRDTDCASMTARADFADYMSYFDIFTHQWDEDFKDIGAELMDGSCKQLFHLGVVRPPPRSEMLKEASVAFTALSKNPLRSFEMDLKLFPESATIINSPLILKKTKIKK